MAYATIASRSNIFFTDSPWISSKLLSSHSSSLIQFNKKKKKKKCKGVSVPFVSASSASIPYPPINLEYLRREFSGHGATFEDIGETCIAKLKLENRSSATVVLSRGMVTSYKVPVWHGGKMELLHTWVSEEEDDEVVIQGGVSSAIFPDDQDLDEISSWSMPSGWILQGIAGDSQDYVQVELARRDVDNMLEMKQVITLGQETLSCELTVTNKNLSPVQIKCSLLSHLTVSTPEATYAVGLHGSNYVEKTPFLPCPETIIEEDEGEKPGFGGNKEEIEYEEQSNYKQLNEEMSRIYTCAPQSFTVIDRGRRNSVVVGREGLEEVYMFSPGSRGLESYSKSAYVCIGHSALLKPISLEPCSVWRAVQHVHNPNS
ncbi:PREDICTED: protein NDH-DEPENDENT CYCLIC ELECTRON FLOW 5-like [Tarenaya hassleriana]|uniref:protein NDH-DEPENDENT CYCLIC ELECTRON FLOW 5-like n=1 Tax=Tarenaya hassleriana TaxID=28532 RepID=UPI00053C09F0|nr:PREDICTED: protein NDH-DEPENDENT CYCLIC ELECTRON FLOW 5-like [Tarenaya hassleriana]